ncbi:MAG: site-specific integrase [Candidatus Obscuribacterales bacterium]|jgi:integrase
MPLLKRGKVWYVRTQAAGYEVCRAIGPDKSLAAHAQAALDKEISNAKASNKRWTGIDRILNDRNQITFAEAAQGYMEQLANPKPSTVASYSGNLKADLLPAFGDMPLADIKPIHVRKFQAELAKRVSPVRVNTVTQLLRSIMKQAVMDELIDRDPCLAVKRLEEPTQDIDPFDDEELALILSNIEPHYQPFFTALAFTGARPNELMALRFSDVDWRKKEIRITKGRVRGHEGTPKTPSSKRTVPLNDKALEAFERAKIRPVANLADYVFVDRAGEPVGKHLYRAWRSALKASGVRHRPSYQLRHTFISQCLLKGLPVQYVAKIVGHSGIETTVRNYARWIDSSTAAYDDKMRAAFSTSALKLAHK